MSPYEIATQIVFDPSTASERELALAAGFMKALDGLETVWSLARSGEPKNLISATANDYINSLKGNGEL